LCGAASTGTPKVKAFTLYGKTPRQARSPATLRSFFSGFRIRYLPTMTDFHVWDAAELLETEEDMAAYLNAALEDGNRAVIELAFSNIALAKARQTAR
jgi:hypothetical protein